MPTSRPTARPQSASSTRHASPDSPRKAPDAPRKSTDRTPSDRAHPPTRRGRNAARANATRSDQNRNSGPNLRAESQQTNSPQTRQSQGRAKVDLFASFDTGNPPNLEATFEELGVPAKLIRELKSQGIDKPFPIQAATMADCLAGRDVLGRGRTGSGKTLAFVLPVLTRLAANPVQRRAGRPRALILVPTRELALQIHTAMEPLARLLSLTTTTIFGGVGANPQINALRQGVDIVIACPGRLDDHIQSNHARLDAIEITVLDEADHMADMGFLPVVKKLLDQTPQDTQHLLFSATLDNGIDTLVNRYLHNPILRSVDPVESVEVKMTHHVFAVSSDDRFPVLRDLAAAPGRIIVFTRTKHGAKKLAKTLIASGVPTVELQGNLSQNVRTRNLEAFRSGEAAALVATDIAARGIHIDEVALVVHFDPPVDHKAYLHRSGRTARAGAEGTVVTMMLDSQGSEVRDLTRKAGINPTNTKVTPDHPILQVVAPGERTFVEPKAAEAQPVRQPAAPRGSASPRKAPRGNTPRGSTARGNTGQRSGGPRQGTSGRVEARGNGAPRNATERTQIAGAPASRRNDAADSRPAQPSQAGQPRRSGAPSQTGNRSGTANRSSSGGRPGSGNRTGTSSRSW